MIVVVFRDFAWILQFVHSILMKFCIGSQTILSEFRDNFQNFNGQLNDVDSFAEMFATFCKHFASFHKSLLDFSENWNFRNRRKSSFFNSLVVLHSPPKKSFASCPATPEPSSKKKPAERGGRRAGAWARGRAGEARKRLGGGPL